ncbi:MAG: hypothetical protein J5565_02890 [Muribaculaceae bacterium]|nr:hypothetical protein [Muribaculaceae bacterium]
MKRILSSFRVRCVLAFFIILSLRVAWCRLIPSDDPEGSNLLVNVVFALILTGMYAVADYIVTKKVKRHKKANQR